MKQHNMLPFRPLGLGIIALAAMASAQNVQRYCSSDNTGSDYSPREYPMATGGQLLTHTDMSQNSAYTTRLACVLTTAGPSTRLLSSSFRTAGARITRLETPPRPTTAKQIVLVILLKNAATTAVVCSATLPSISLHLAPLEDPAQRPQDNRSVQYPSPLYTVPSKHKSWRAFQCLLIVRCETMACTDWP